MHIDITEDLINLYEKHDYLNIVKYIAEKYCKFTNIELNYLDKFWDFDYNNNWLYLTKDMLINDFGYKNGKSMMSNFYKRILYNNFEIDKDYKLVDKQYILDNYDNDTILFDKRGHLKKHYIISGICYKGILMIVQTEQGRQFQRYYIKLDYLFVRTHKLISEIQVKIIKKKLTKNFDKFTLNI